MKNILKGNEGIDSKNHGLYDPISLRTKLVKNEVKEIINNKEHRTKFLAYIKLQYEDLASVNESSNPEVFSICMKGFNLMLRLFIENEEYKGFLLSGKKGTEMDKFRENIVIYYSEFIDKDIIDLLSLNLELKIEDDKILEELLEEPLKNAIVLEDDFIESEIDTDFEEPLDLDN